MRAASRLGTEEHVMTSPLQAQMRSTYRYLRMSMPLLGVVLATSVLIQVYSTEPRCWLGSISAYYYTPAREVFVAALCAIGTALVIFKASTTREDIALNIAGVGAFALALIPTPLKTITADADFEKCSRSNEPTAEQLSAALANNALTLAIGITLLTVAFLVCLVVLGPGNGRPHPGSVVAACVLSLVAWGGYVIWQATDASVRDVERVGHTLGTAFLFVGITFMILVQLWPRFTVAGGQETRDASAGVYAYGYYASLVIMLVGGAVFGYLWLFEDNKLNALFWFETSMIVSFVSFWSLQTVEKWGLED